MGHWNHRIVHNKTIISNPDGTMEEQEMYGICEVYYDGKKNPITCSEPIICRDSIDGLKEELDWISKAFEKDILEHDKLCEAADKLKSDLKESESYSVELAQIIADKMFSDDPEKLEAFTEGIELLKKQFPDKDIKVSPEIFDNLYSPDDQDPEG